MKKQPDKNPPKSAGREKPVFHRVAAGEHGALSRWSRDGERTSDLSRDEEFELRRRFREIAALRREVEDFTKSEGEIFEHECGAALAESGALGEIAFDEIVCNLQAAPNDPEFDIVARNGKITVVGESKRTLRTDDVRHFAEKRLPVFAVFHPEWAKGRKVVGAMFFKRAAKSKPRRGASAAESDPVALAQSLGLIAVRATGNTRLEIIPRRK